MNTNEERKYAILEYTNSLTKDLDLSSAQLLFNRRLKTTIPIYENLLTTRNNKHFQAKIQFYYDKNARKRNEFSIGQKIYVQDHSKK